MKSGWVYILRCADGSYYTGSTSNLEQRIAQHRLGEFGGYTSSRLSVTVAFVQEFADIRDAICAERQIKGWTRRKKEALIYGDYDSLPSLSRSRKERQE
jgi:putative endonuclease